MTDSNTSRYRRESIQIGPVVVWGIMKPDGTYRMTDADAAKSIGENPRSFGNFRRSIESQKSLKSLQGNGLAVSQLSVRPPDKVPLEGHNTKVNASTLEDVVKYWASFGRSNALAYALVIACATETLDRRFDRAFDRLVSEEERDIRLLERIERIAARWDWCDVVKQRMISYGYYHSDRERVISEFKHLTVLVNTALFGVPHFKRDRDNMTQDQQRTIAAFERLLKIKADRCPNLTPYELVDVVLSIF